MRRLLISLAVIALLVISISVGVITAEWPRWRHVFGITSPEAAPAEAENAGS